MSNAEIREVMSMLDCKFQVAKRVVRLANAESGTVDNTTQVRKLTRDGRAPLTQSWAAEVLAQARVRIAAADGDP